jgi:hypothetical protein
MAQHILGNLLPDRFRARTIEAIVEALIVLRAVAIVIVLSISAIAAALVVMAIAALILFGAPP